MCAFATVYLSVSFRVIETDMQMRGPSAEIASLSGIDLFSGLGGGGEVTTGQNFLRLFTYI